MTVIFSWPTVAAVPAGRIGPPIDDVVETEIDESVALFHPVSGEAVVLNSTASDIWRLSDGELTLDELTAVLARSYGVDPGAIRDDVVRAVGDLRARGLLCDDGG